MLSPAKSCSHWHVWAGLTLTVMGLSAAACRATQVIFTLTINKCGLILFTFESLAIVTTFFPAEELFVDNSLY